MRARYIVKFILTSVKNYFIFKIYIQQSFNRLLLVQNWSKASAIETLWGLWHIIPHGQSCFLKTQEVRLFKISKQFSVPNSGNKTTSILSSLYCVSVLLCPLSYRPITSKWIWYRLHSWQLQGPFWTFSWGQIHLSCMSTTAIPYTGTVLQNTMKNHSQHPSSKALSTK